MIKSTIKEEILKKLDSLPAEKQEKVLKFVGRLTEERISGIPGQKLLHFSGTIGKKDLDSMRQAIEEGCEKVDLNEW